jgi:hypothetical protein
MKLYRWMIDGIPLGSNPSGAGFHPSTEKAKSSSCKFEEGDALLREFF